MDVEAFIRNEKPVSFDELDDFDIINDNIEDTNHEVDEINDINTRKDICVSKEVNCDLRKTQVNEDLSTHIFGKNIKFEPIVESCDENEKENSVTTSGEILSREDIDISVKNNEEHTILNVTKSEDSKEVNIKVENEKSGFQNITEKTTIVDVKNQGNVPIENNMKSDKSDNVANDDQKRYIVADIKKEEKCSLKNESDLDSKLNEMQEKAMKKFKGSFLDSIF